MTNMRIAPPLGWLYPVDLSGFQAAPTQNGAARTSDTPRNYTCSWAAASASLGGGLTTGRSASGRRCRARRWATLPSHPPSREVRGEYRLDKGTCFLVLPHPSKRCVVVDAESFSDFFGSNAALGHNGDLERTVPSFCYELRAHVEHLTSSPFSHVSHPLSPLGREGGYETMCCRYFETAARTSCHRVA